MNDLEQYRQKLLGMTREELLAEKARHDKIDEVMREWGKAMRRENRMFAAMIVDLAEEGIRTWAKNDPQVRRAYEGYLAQEKAYLRRTA